MKNGGALRALFLALFFAAVMTRPAAAGPQDFVLVNRTGYVVYVVNLSPSKAERWGGDILGARTLADGEAVAVRFRAEKERHWDIRVRFADGSGLYWRGIDLFQARRVTLNGDATATLQIVGAETRAAPPKEAAAHDRADAPPAC